MQEVTIEAVPLAQYLRGLTGEIITVGIGDDGKIGAVTIDSGLADQGDPSGFNRNGDYPGLPPK